MKAKALRYLLAFLFLQMMVSGLIWRLDVSNKSIEFDQGLYLYTADRIYTGQADYTDDFDNMPPGIYYLYMAGFLVFGNNPISSHLVTVISDYGIILMLFLIGYLLRGPTAGFAASGMYGACYVMIRWAPKGGNENPMTLLLLASLAIYLFVQFRANRRQGLLLAGAGALAGCAFMVKQPAVFFLLTPFLHQAYLVGSRVRPPKKALGDLAWFGMGFGVILAVVTLWLLAKGILYAALYNAFIFPMSAQREYGMDFDQRWEEFYVSGFEMMPALFALALASWAVYLIRRDKVNLVPLAYCLPVVIYLLWTGDYFQHYLIQLVPGLCISAAMLFHDAFDQEGRWWFKIIIVLVVLHFAFGNNVRVSDAIIEQRRQVERSPVFYTQEVRTLRDDQLDYQLMVGRFLRHYMEPGDKLVTSTPTYAYLARVPNSYSHFYIAPLTRQASNEFEDLPSAARSARFYVTEGWRKLFIPPEFQRELDNKWKRVDWITHDGIMDLEVWENPRFAKIHTQEKHAPPKN